MAVDAPPAVPSFGTTAVGGRRRARGPLPSAQARRARGDSRGPRRRRRSPRRAREPHPATLNRLIDVDAGCSARSGGRGRVRAPRLVEAGARAARGVRCRPTIEGRRSWRPTRRSLVWTPSEELDREARADRKIGRRAMMALLVCAGVARQRTGRRLARARGPRQSQALCARREDPERGSQGRPDAADGRRGLVAYLHQHVMTEEGWLFPTASGRRRNKDNVNRHVVRPAVVRARACGEPWGRGAAGPGDSAHPAPDLHQLDARGRRERPLCDGPGGTPTRIRRCGSTRRSSTVTARRSGRRLTR